MGITVRDLAVAPRQTWGVERLTGRDATGNLVELSVYGRDASDARAMAKLWRFCFYRDSGPTLILDRLLQVEHEAYLSLMAGRTGVLVPRVMAAGRFGPSGDAALVTRLPDGPRLAQADPDTIPGAALDEVLHTVLCLRQAGIAHGSLGAETVIFSADGVCITDFRCASASAPAERLDGDLAAALGALAAWAGVERTAGSSSVRATTWRPRSARGPSRPPAAGWPRARYFSSLSASRPVTSTRRKARVATRARSGSCSVWYWPPGSPPPW